MINIDNIIVIDQYLPAWLQDSIENQIKDFQGWHVIADEARKEYHYNKILYDIQHNIPWAHENGLTRILNEAFILNAVNLAFPDATINALKRVRLNGTFNFSNLKPHTDSYPEDIGAWTVVYHLCGNDGATVFYHDEGNTIAKVVPFKKGQAIIFPSIYFHKGESPLTTQRVTANMEYIISTKLNENIFLTTGFTNE